MLNKAMAAPTRITAVIKRITVVFFFIIQSSKQIIKLLNFIVVRFAFDQSSSYRNSYTSLAFPKMLAK